MIMSVSTITNISAVQARNSFGELINRAVFGGETFVVERAGKPVVKIEAVRQARQKRDAKERLFAIREEVLKRVEGIDEAELRRAVDQAIAEVRGEQKHNLAKV